MAQRASATGQKALVDALLSLSRVLVATTARSLSGLDIDVTLQQYRVLVMLASRGPLKSADVARELGVAPSTGTRMIDRLVARNVVRRLRHPDDRRTVYVALTDAGRDVVGEVMRARRAELRRLVRRVDGPAGPEVVDLLRGLVEAAGEVPDPQWWQRWRTSATGPTGTMWEEPA